MRPILRGGKKYPTRILRPKEYDQLRRELKTTQRQRLDGLLLTGMRYVEAQRLQEHPEWVYGNGFIEMPPGSSLKKEMKYTRRTIRLSNMGEELVPLFIDAPKLPTRQTWRENLRRWARDADLDPTGISAKTTRKTWESWLVHTNENRLAHIFQSQGHTEKTALKHYVSLPFDKEDERGMEKWVQGWI